MNGQPELKLFFIRVKKCINFRLSSKNAIDFHFCVVKNRTQSSLISVIQDKLFFVIYYFVLVFFCVGILFFFLQIPHKSYLFNSQNERKIPRLRPNLGICSIATEPWHFLMRPLKKNRRVGQKLRSALTSSGKFYFHFTPEVIQFPLFDGPLAGITVDGICAHPLSGCTDFFLASRGQVQSR